MHGVIDEKLWNPFRDSVSGAARIKGTANKLIQTLTGVFEADHVKSTVGLRVSGDGKGGAALESPVGAGRLRLEFCVHADEIAGKLIVDRRMINGQGAIIWLPVWAISVPAYGNPVMADGEGGPIALNDMFGQAKFNSAFVAGMSMLYAITVDSPDAALLEIAEAVESEQTS